MTGEGEHGGLAEPPESFSVQVVPACHRSVPSPRSKHITVRRCSLVRLCVTNTRLPQTTGVELPGPGKDMHQRTFWFVLQRRGSRFSEQMPFPSGPRQAGQFAPTALIVGAAPEGPRAGNGEWLCRCAFVTAVCLTNCRESNRKCRSDSSTLSSEPVQYSYFSSLNHFPTSAFGDARPQPAPQPRNQVLLVFERQGARNTPRR